MVAEQSIAGSSRINYIERRQFYRNKKETKHLEVLEW